MGTTKALTEKQKTAIANLEKAIKEIGKCGITIFGMDCDICFVTNSAIKECQGNDSSIGSNYNPAADTYRVLQYHHLTDKRFGTIKTGRTYMDSGGW